MNTLGAIAITGPTASGKTALSISLARSLGCEIISLDSMQIYKGMDVGTAKATAEERATVAHHMLDVVLPSEEYSTELYRDAALKAARDIVLGGKIPLFVGGTGLYLDTLLRAPQTDVPKSDALRDSLIRSAQDETGRHALWERLRTIDPDSAEKIHENNVRRVARAIEIYESTGRTKTELDRLSKERAEDINILNLTLDFHNRDTLYERVDKRVDLMIEGGLVPEVETLYKSGRLPKESTAAQAIGYKEIISYIDGECTLAEAVLKIKLSTRHYAKRQITWFRHTDALRIYMDSEDGSLRLPEEILSELILHTKAFLDKNKRADLPVIKFKG